MEQREERRIFYFCVSVLCASVVAGLVVIVVIYLFLGSPKPLAERLRTDTGSFVLLCVNANEETIAEGQYLTVYPTHGYGNVMHPHISAGDHCAVMSIETGNACYRVVTGTAVTGLKVVYAASDGQQKSQSVQRNPIGKFEINSGEFEWCTVGRPDNVPILRVGRVREGMPLRPLDAK